MGIPSFLIASTLNVSVAQRLVRKLCQHVCKKEAAVSQIELFPADFKIPKQLKNAFQSGGL